MSVLAKSAETLNARLREYPGGDGGLKGEKLSTRVSPPPPPE